MEEYGVTQTDFYKYKDGGKISLMTDSILYTIFVAPGDLD